MEFGKLENIDEVNWEIPADDPSSALYFTQLNNSKRTTQWRLGTPTWGSRTWPGKIYPREATSKDFLHYYARAFNTIELNTTHYRIPDGPQIKSWTAQVPATFKFCPKFPQDISHRVNGLKDKNTLLRWQQSLSDFGSNLGVTWLQLPPYFDYSQRAQLHAFLEAWPQEFPLALELRHQSWFQQHTILPALVDYLRKKNVGLVITDVAGKRDVLHTSISAPFVLLRFIGNELHPSDFSRSDAWCDRLKKWSEMGLQDIYFFAHEPDDVTCPELTAYLVKLFNERTNANWVDPWHQSQNNLQLL